MNMGPRGNLQALLTCQGFRFIREKHKSVLIENVSDGEKSFLRLTPGCFGYPA
jgi:hypothetical protein